MHFCSARGFRRRWTVDDAPFFKRPAIAGRRHHLTTICGRLVTEVAMHSPLLVCADRARTYRCLDDTSTPHGRVGLCPVQCLLCTAGPACDVVLLNALLCVHGAFTRAAYICRIHRSLQISCYHGVARNWGAALPRCRCMPVCGVSVLFRLNIYFGGIARLEHQMSPGHKASP